ncbi:hypothetical protein JOF42_001434 [Microbacterium phyllosphaerae]|uniref:Uncharacterized protein n=1 Tax=Microbacterium phyllosphaerae TaxID=124798 RepID=A0ABS4WP08_9MICO|nr:hypothetical protein [Microbacterium phyllosphaerae]MBP2377939.1 hypothetical protein [Microbacterium phyllosphaerae]
MIEISAEVRQVLGDIVADRIKSDHVDAICDVDGTRVSSERGDDIAVIVHCYLDETIVRFAHATCAFSEALYYSTAAAPMSFEDVRVSAVLLPGAGGYRAAVIIAPQSLQREYLPSGDSMSLIMNVFLSLGMELTGKLGASGPLLSDCVTVINPSRASGRIVGPEVGLDVLESFEWANPEWPTIAARSGEMTLFVTDANLDDIVQDDRQVIFQVLNNAAKQGRVAVARLSVKIDFERTVQSEVDSVIAAAHDLADTLDSFTRRRAPSLVAGDLLFGHRLATKPALLPVRIDSFAVLIIDLNDPDESRARYSLGLMRDAGFPDNSGIDNDDLIQPGPGWSAVLWPSQVHIFAPGLDQRKHALLFASFDGVDEKWFEAARRSMAFAIIVGNHIVDAGMDEQTLIDQLRSGAWLGAAMPILPSR